MNSSSSWKSRKKYTGLAYWACRSCIVYAQGMNHRLKEMERRLDNIEETGKKNKDDNVRIEKRVDKLEEKLERAAAARRPCLRR
jgi:tetrahydromethanopterin S-methyltransferase subunit G